MKGKNLKPKPEKVVPVARAQFPSTGRPPVKKAVKK